MLEVFTLVSTKKPLWKQIMAYVFFLLAIIFAALGCLTIYLFPVALIMGGFWYLFQFRSYKEYEYSYFDGEARFAKIMNKSRRKRLAVYTMDQILQIAPAGDRSLYKYENDTQVKVCDYTSGIADTPYYEMIVKAPEAIIMIKFEPDDEYLDAICMKYAQKVIRRPSTSV